MEAIADGEPLEDQRLNALCGRLVFAFVRQMDRQCDRADRLVAADGFQHQAFVASDQEFRFVRVVAEFFHQESHDLGAKLACDRG